jgi:hypothetical protein
MMQVSPQTRLLTPEQAWARKEPEWLVDHVLPTNALSLLYGDEQTYKSFLALDLACCVGTGQPWHGHDVVHPGRVVYVTAEGEDCFGKRLKGWADDHGVTLADTQVHQFPDPVDLSQSEEMQALLDDLAVLPPADPVRLVIFDTLAGCLGAGEGDESLNRDIGRVTHQLNVLRKATGANCLVIHHEGHKRGRPRGGSSLKGNWPVRLHVTAKEYACTVTNQKQANSRRFLPLHLSLREVPVTLPSGTSDTSLVVSDGDPAQLAAPKSTKRQRRHTEDEVLRVVVKLETVTAARLAQALHITRGPASARIRHLVKQHYLEKSGRGQYRVTPLAQRLAA